MGHALGYPPPWLGIGSACLVCPHRVFQTKSICIISMEDGCSMLKLSNSLLTILKTWFRASKLLFILHVIYIGFQFPYGNFIFLSLRIHTLLMKPTLTNWYATARRYRSSQEFHSLSLCYCHSSSREVDKVLFQTTNSESTFYLISQEMIQQSRNYLPGTCTKIFSTKRGQSIWLL